MIDGDPLGRAGIVEDLLAAADRGVVLIGPPGSGLSSVLRHLAATIASEGRDVHLVRYPDDRHLATDDGDDRLVIIDDAHHASDRQILALRDRALSGAVVLGCRTGAASEQLSWLWRSGAVVQLELDRLDDPTIACLVEARAGGPVHRATTEGIVRRAGGRPGFVVDEVDSLRADGRLPERSGLLRGRLTGQVGTRAIERARHILAELPEELAEMLRVIAIADWLPTGGVAALHLDLPDLERRSLVDRADGVRLDPPILAAAVRATIAPDRAITLARSVLGALAGSMTTDQHARLHLLAGHPVDLDELVAATWTALRDDQPSEALGLARQAAQHGPDGLALEAQVLAELGARDDASERYGALMVDPRASSELRARAAMEYSQILLWDLGRSHEAVDVATALCAAVRGTAFFPGAQVHLAGLMLYAGRPSQAAALLETIDGDGGDDMIAAGMRVVELISLSLVDPTRCDPEVARRLIDVDPGSGFEPGAVVAAVELSLELVGRYVDAEKAIESAHGARSTGDTPASSAWSSLAQARCELAIGRHHEARRAALESALMFSDVNHPTGMRWATAAAMLASALAGDRRATRLALDAYERMELGVPLLDADLLRARAWATWVLGDGTLAARLMNEAAGVAAAMGTATMEAVALHDSFRLFDTPVASRLSELAQLAPVPSITLRARHVELVVAGDPNALLELSADLEAAGVLLLAAEVAADAERAAASRGMRAVARTAVGQRRRLASLCGNPMTPHLSDHQSITLTGRERDVATLAVDGLSSPAIAERFSISVRTVENLLQRVYVKLGVHGRSELAAAWPDADRNGMTTGVGRRPRRDL